MSSIASLMTRNPVMLKPHDTVLRAAQLMDELNVGCLPVGENRRVVGILTDRDITVRAIAAGLSPASTEVELVMSDRVRCCRPDQSATEVLQQMAAVQIRRLPVIDDGGRIVGMVSIGDLAAREPAGVEDALRRISTPAEPDRAAIVA